MKNFYFNAIAILLFLVFYSCNPTISSFSPDNACPGGSVTITGNNLGTTYEAKIGGNPTAIFSTSPNSVVLSVGNGTTGQISIVATNGTATSSGILTVNKLSSAPIGISGNALICRGDSTTLTLNGGTAGTGATAQWFTNSCGGTIVPGSGNTRTVSPNSTTTYYVRYAGSCNSTACAEITVTVNNSIAPTNISGDIDICNGETTSLTVIGGSLASPSTIEWFSNSCGGASAGTGATINVSPTTNTTYYVRYKDSCNTTTCASVLVSVTPVPQSSGPISGKTTVCQGENSVTFSVPIITNATDYNWSLTPGANLVSGAGTNSITVNFGVTSSSGTISVYGVNNTCTGIPSNFPITVNSLPSAAGSIMGTAIICQGDTGIFFSIPSIPNATQGYSWTLPVGATITSGFNTENITVDFSDVAVSGAISVQGKNACGFGTISNYPVTVNVPSVAPTNITGNSNLCGATSTTLTVNGGLAGNGADAEWFSGSCNGSQVGIGQSINVSPTSTTTYYVRYRGDCNITECASVEVVVDTVPPLPDLAFLPDVIAQCSVNSLAAPTAIDNCAGSVIGITNVTLPITAQGSTIIIWTYADAFGNTSTQTQNVIITDTTAPTPSLASLADIIAECSVTSLIAPIATDNCGGTVTITNNAALPFNTLGTRIITWTYKDALGNTSTQTQKVIVVADITPPVARCLSGVEVTLNAAGTASITASQINNGSTDNCSGIQSMSLSNSLFNCSNLGINTVILTVRDYAGNVSTCTTNVTVLDPAANASVIINSNDTNNEICNGENITFTAIPTNGGTAPKYEWFIDGVSFGTNNATFTPFSPLTVGTHTIYVEMQSKLSVCPSPKRSNTITVVVSPTPIVTAPTKLCIGSNGNLTPSSGGTWTSSNNALATVTNAGVINAIAPGAVTFTFTNSATGCSKKTNTVIINALPTITNLPTNSDICVNEKHTLSPTTGGTWSSSNTSIATITNAGVITGISLGTVNFTYINTATGCSSAITNIQVLNIPEIISVTASPTSICAGDESILTTIVAGTSATTDVLVNYDFNSGTQYGPAAISGGQVFTGITSSLTSSNIDYDRSQNGKAITSPPAFTANALSKALRQIDDWTDGPISGKGDPGGFLDDGDWTFALGGAALTNYRTFQIYFDAKREVTGGYNKTIIVEYRSNNGPWNTAGSLALRNNSNAWTNYTAALTGVINPNSLEIRLNVNDGSNYRYRSGERYDNYIEPHVLIDNFQVKASTVASVYSYNWTVVSGDYSSLPSNITTPQITVTPDVTSVYQVSVTNSDGCPATRNVKVTVKPSPIITFTTNFCPNAPHGNEVEITASSSIPGTTWKWIITYPTVGQPGYSHTGHSNTSAKAYVDIAGTYQVIATAPNGCSTSATIDIATELVNNGNFEQGNDGSFGSNYAYHPDVAGNNELVNDSGNNGYSITTNGLNVHPNFNGVDHTSGTGNFMAVNGHGTEFIVWYQTVTVEANTEYYFAGWARSLNSVGPFGKLRFRVNGAQLGSQLNLASYPTKNWDRFYGTWNSGNVSGDILIEIVNNESAFGGNDFAIDDISFSTLDPFIILTSADYTDDDQVICQNTAFDDITYNVGGGSNGVDIQWWFNGIQVGVGPLPNNNLPAGIQTSFDGAKFTIFGTPDLSGKYTYTISTSSICGTPKTASGKIVVNKAPIVTINPIASTVCFRDGNIALNATLSGSATSGVWMSTGTGTFTPNSANPNATYNFGTSDSGIITLTFTTNDPDGTGINGPCTVAVASVDIYITPNIIATAGPDQTSGSCGVNTVTLAANNVTGHWTAIPNTGYFSDASAYNSTFTGESGETYSLIWTVSNATPCNNTFDTVEISIPNCGNFLIFDGADDTISFGDYYGLNSGSFSIEAWIKPDRLTGTQTILSKRNANNLSTGYDFSLVDKRLFFRWNGAQVFANQTMTMNRWYHVAVTFDGDKYQLYIDGFPVNNATIGFTPSSNVNKALIGAMDRSIAQPTNFFSGGIDEVRIWNTSLTLTQIREMMNQEIKTSPKVSGNVSGVVIPLDISGLKWNNLIGYYQMKSGPQSLVSNGLIANISTVSQDAPPSGKLNNMTDNQEESAPIPYISIADGAWDSVSTWSHGTVQQLPNSAENSINGELQTWNIVKTASNVTSGDRTTTLLGLLIGSGNYSITNDQLLSVNNYLLIDGVLDLQGESQLMQNETAFIDYVKSSGFMERDQQGIANTFSYNYWGSPVSTRIQDGARAYTLKDILYDGNLPVTWVTGNNGSNGSPISISTRWIYSFSEGLQNNYSAWALQKNTGVFKAGLGFTMKGPGLLNAAGNQNYTFRGMPNNGDITTTVTANADFINQTLVGNPYASAINANNFIRDNMPGGNAGTTASIDGSLYFWKQASTNNSHVLAEYKGGYAIYNLSGSTPAVSPPGIDNNPGDAAFVLPSQFIPVGQGFFVNAASNQASGPGHNIVRFKNSQRAFVKENSGNSVFFRTGPEDEEQPVNRVRLNFKTPEGATRPLLLAFTPNNEATDGFDYGYDAVNSDEFTSDAAFKIADENYVIQGVGAFDDSKQYPFALKMGIAGPVSFELTELENFETPIDVYVYDSVLGTYHAINTTSFVIHLDAGTYDNRFFLTFREDDTLSTIDSEFKNVVVNYLQKTDDIYIKVPSSIFVKQIYLINIAGQVVKGWNSTNLPISQEMKIPVRDIAEGHYIVKIITDTNSFSKKITVKY